MQDKIIAIANGSVDIQNVNDNGILEVSPEYDEGLWTANADNSYTYNSTTALWIKITSIVPGGIAATANIQRAAPCLQLEKLVNGVWEPVDDARSCTGYIRDFSAHNDSSNGFTYRDVNPGPNPTYRFATIQESTITGVVTSTGGDVDFEACDSGPSDTFASACIGLNITFENFSQFALGFGVNNSSTVAQRWQYKIEGANFNLMNDYNNNGQPDYLDYSNAADFEYTVVELIPGLLYENIFTAINPLQPGQNVNYELQNANLGFPPATSNSSILCQ